MITTNAKQNFDQEKYADAVQDYRYAQTFLGKKMFNANIKLAINRFLVEQEAVFEGKHLTQEESTTLVFKINSENEANQAIFWYQRNKHKVLKPSILFIATSKLDNLVAASFYQKFNNYGITVTSSSFAVDYAHLENYQPIETTHFIYIDLNLANPILAIKEKKPAHQFLNWLLKNDIK